MILILIDTLRADYLGCYGGDADLTPTLDRIASEGVLFERATAPSPWTLPSVASLFSGYYPSVHKADNYKAVTGKHGGAAGVQVFGEQFDTLAEIAAEHGYATGAFVSNPFIVRRSGFAQGFERFEFVGDRAPGTDVTRAALQWLRERDPQRPFLAYLHYMEPHAPYIADRSIVEGLLDQVEAAGRRHELSEDQKAKYRKYLQRSMRPYLHDARHVALMHTQEYWRARYAACVRQVDQRVEALRSELLEQGLWESACVVIVADHGEALGEHTLFGHGASAYQHQLNVPFLIRLPSAAPAGARVSQTVGLFDAMPTILDYLGLPAPADIQARSLRGLIDGAASDPRTAFAEAVNTQPGLKIVLDGDWKLLAHTDASRYELFNLKDDPGELSNVAGSHPKQLAKLKALLDAQLAENERLGATVAVETAEVSEAEMRRLSALGYTGGVEDHHEDDEQGEVDNGGAIDFEGRDDDGGVLEPADSTTSGVRTPHPSATQPAASSQPTSTRPHEAP